MNVDDKLIKIIRDLEKERDSYRRKFLVYREANVHVCQLLEKRYAKNEFSDYHNTTDWSQGKRLEVIEFMKNFPAGVTSHDLKDKWPDNHKNYTSRLGELFNRGIVYKDEEKRLPKGGLRKLVVYRLTELL